MDSHQQFDKVRNYLLELEYDIVEVNETETLMVIEKEDVGIMHLVLDVSDPILIMEQPLFVLSHNNADVLRSLLRKNMDIVHGAFALTEDNYVIFRDTLQLENLDLNELEASLNSLSLLMAEYLEDILTFAKS